jgi:5,10-methylenetetrahydromethanopterin reductase
MVRLAEELGYSHVWFGDSQVIWRELYVNLGAAALATKRVTLAAGVTNPLTRNVTVTASALATLHELTGGRVALGIGTGDSSVETLGERPATLAYLKESIQVIRRLLAGERVALGTGEVHMDWAQVSPIPVFIGASGPRVLRLAGQVADGAIILVGTAPEYLHAALACIRQGAEEAGRDLQAEGFKYVCWVPCAISRDGKAARDLVKAHVARILKRPLPFALSPEEQPVVEQVYQHYEYQQHMVVGSRHSYLVPDHMVTRFAIAGTVEECRRQVERLKETGIHQLAIIPYGANPRDRLSVVKTFAREVMAGT